MSEIMAQAIIRNVLESCYGDSPELRFLMRPDNRFTQYLIAWKILEKYVQIDEQLAQVLPTRRLQERERNRRDLYRTIIADIEEDLDHYSEEAIQNKLRDIIAQGPHPHGSPNFLRSLFTAYE